MSTLNSISHSTYAIVEPDNDTWDAFTQQHPQGHLLQSSGWGELKRQFGWRRRRIAVAGPDGLVAGAQMLLRRRFRLTATYVPRGPLLSGIEEVDQLLLAAMHRTAHRVGSVFLRVEPNILEHDPQADHLHSMLLRYNFHTAEPIQPHSSIHLDLTPDPIELLSKIRKGHRADIRRASRENVDVQVETQTSTLDSFYTILDSTRVRARFDIHSYAYYQTAWNLFSPDSACLLVAQRNDEPEATAMVLAWAGTALYLYSGSTEEGLRNGAQHAIQWRAFQWARQQGCKTYDFWGIPDTLGQAATVDNEQEREQLAESARNDPLYGVYRFKKGFGGDIVRYLPAYDRVYMPTIYAIWLRRGTF